MLEKISRFSRNNNYERIAIKDCPVLKCKGQLEVINGKYGKFLGCNKYPICQYKESY